MLATPHGSAPVSGGPSADVFVALGMVTAPGATARRNQVRGTMLRYEPVLAGRLAFRFIVGDALHLRPRDGGKRRLQDGIEAETTRHGDLVQLEALDGPAIPVACSCVEKTASWVRYALRSWPSARFIGKTEDDTYVQLSVLEAELRALVDRANLMFGYMTLAVLPRRPTVYPEKQPMKACVTLIQECQKQARNRRPPFTAGCFLGDLESKLDVPGKLRFEAGTPWRAGRGKDRDPSPLIGWWRGAARDCGHMRRSSTPATSEPDVRRAARRAARANPDDSLSDDDATSTLAPFPTGPLAVFGRDLAEALFEDCAYVREYESAARAWGRKTLCVGKDEHLSFASTLCDSVLSHWLAACGIEATIAHTTRTKSHHYMWRGAGLGWMPPSNLSLAVHHLKAKADAPSGPNSTAGGEWDHVHATVRHARGVAFPPLLYRMRPHYALNVSGSRRLMRSLNPDVFHWYASECAFEHAALRKATTVRANRATAAVRGGRPVGMNDAKYLGGHPPGWPYSGCNPSRFRPYPRWPPPPEVHEAIRASSTHELGSRRFVYHGHGPSAAELAPRIARAWAALQAAGGISSVSVAKLASILRENLAPLPPPSKSIDVYSEMRRAAEAAPSPSDAAADGIRRGLRKLLFELVHAQLSLDAVVRETESAANAGLLPGFAARDNTYYWTWA